MLPTIDSKAIFARFVTIIQGTAQQLSPQPPKTHYGYCYLCRESLQQPPTYTGASNGEHTQVCLTPDAITQLPNCGHSFHHKCFHLDQHLSCPVCFRPFLVIRISQATDSWIYQCPPHFVRWLSFWSMVLERRKRIPSYSPWRLAAKIRDPKCSFFMPGEVFMQFQRWWCTGGLWGSRLWQKWQKGHTVQKSRASAVRLLFIVIDVCLFVDGGAWEEVLWGVRL